jgi:hypothetical protein
MNRTTALLALLALAVGFGLGRIAVPDPAAEISTLSSFERALDDPDWIARSFRLGGFLQGLSPENLPGALDALEARLPWLATDDLRIFMLAWSRFDPLGALERALGWPGQFQRNGSGAAIYAWAYRDPAAALQALDSIDNPELKAFMEGRLLAGWVHGEHKESAERFIASLPEGQRRFAFVSMLAWELSKQGTDVLMGWAEGVSEDEPTYKAAVFLSATSTLAGIDPPGAARWVEEHRGRAYADGVMRIVVRTWATSDPPAAMGWLADRPPGDERNAMVSNAFGLWLGRAPLDAEAWLRAAMPASELDPALRVMVRRAQRDSAAHAMQFALAISDPSLRQETVTKLGAAWLRRDPEAARDWLAGSELSDELEAAILGAHGRSETDGGDTPTQEARVEGGSTGTATQP